MSRLSVLFIALTAIGLLALPTRTIFASHFANIWPLRFSVVPFNLRLLPSPSVEPVTSPKVVPTDSPQLKTPIPTPGRETIPSVPISPHRSSVAALMLPIQESDSVKDSILAEINTYRTSKGKTTVKTDVYTCSFAKVRASELSQNFNHDGFRSRIDAKTLPYSSYALVTENIARSTRYQNVVALWKNSPGHAANMEKDTPFVCVERNGDFYAYEGWKP